MPRKHFWRSPGVLASDVGLFSQPLEGWREVNGAGERSGSAGGGMRVDGEKELEGTRVGKSQRQVGSNPVDGWMADGCDWQCRVHSRDIHPKQELAEAGVGVCRRGRTCEREACCNDGGGGRVKETREKDQKETTTTVTMVTSRFPPEART